MERANALVLKKQKVEREIATTRRKLALVAWSERLDERLSKACLDRDMHIKGWVTWLFLTTLPLSISVLSLIVLLEEGLPRDDQDSLKRRMVELQEQHEVFERNILFASRPDPYR